MTPLRSLCFVLPFLVVGCSRPTAEEYFSRAQKKAQEAAQSADTLRSADAVREAFQPAIALFESVVREYPRHALADSALYAIANIKNGNMHMPQEAIDAYRLYCLDYPSGKQVPMAMFLIGYLYNNELHNSDSAAAAYRRFLERFPESEMAPSAKFELGTLGKTPDEALPVPPAPAEKPVKKHVHGTTT